MPKVPLHDSHQLWSLHGFTFAAGGCPTLENYRELKTQKVRHHKYVRGYTPPFPHPFTITVIGRNGTSSRTSSESRQ